MFNGCRSDASRIAAITSTIQTYREAADYFPVIRRVIDRFDGKVFNCRFETALREATGAHISARKSDALLTVYLYTNTPGVYTTITLASIPLKALKDGKRIPGAVLLQSARERRERLLKDAAELEEALTRADDTVKRIQYFIQQANKLTESLPYEVRLAYNLKHFY